MKDITLRISTKHLLGEEMGREAPLPVAQEKSLAALISPGALFARVDLPGLPYRRFLDHVNDLRALSHELIARRRATGSSGPDLLSSLIAAADSGEVPISDPQIVGHLGVLLAASHETTAFACSTALLLMSQHPHIAAGVTEEIDSVLRGNPPTADDLRRLPQLDGVILESLRLLPPAPWTSRETTETTEVCGFEIKAETELIPSIFHTHRLPEIWPDGASFAPERWQKQNPSPYEFNPFGGGPRICLGRNLAMLEIRVILALVLMKFRFECPPEARIDPCMSVTMSYRNGLPMRALTVNGGWGRSACSIVGDIHHYIDLPQPA